MRLPAALLSFVFMCIGGGTTMQAGPLTPDEACRLIEMAGASENGRASQSTGDGSATVTLRPPGQNWRVAVGSS